MTITGSYVGTDTTFAPGLGNGDGVFLGSAGSVVGGDTLAERNVISGNVGWGVLLQLGGVNNQILGNKIGLNDDGSAALPNGDGGIWVLSTPGTRIGSGAASEGNSIGGNSGSGIVVEGAASAGAVIEGNGIGADQPNTADGIHVGNAVVDVSIGGDGSAGNIIHSNAGAGIAVFGPGTAANGIEILGQLDLQQRRARDRPRLRRRHSRTTPATATPGRTTS